MNDMKDYEKKIIDLDEIQGTDIKINPDYYIHNALVKAQAALSDNNIQEGIIKFRILIENIEVMAKASNMLTDEYDKEMDEYKKSKEYIDSEKAIKQAKLANKKLELLMRSVFKSKPIADNLKL